MRNAKREKLKEKLTEFFQVVSFFELAGPRLLATAAAAAWLLLDWWIGRLMIIHVAGRARRRRRRPVLRKWRRRLLIATGRFVTGARRSLMTLLISTGGQWRRFAVWIQRLLDANAQRHRGQVLLQYQTVALAFFVHVWDVLHFQNVVRQRVLRVMEHLAQFVFLHLFVVSSASNVMRFDY